LKGKKGEMAKVKRQDKLERRFKGAAAAMTALPPSFSRPNP